jgi:adenylate kinase
VPDEIYRLWKSRLQTLSTDIGSAELDILLLDGIPRVEAGEVMKPVIEANKVFHLSCPDRAKLVERLRNARSRRTARRR